MEAAVNTSNKERETSIVNALMALYNSQSKRVKRAFRIRLSKEEKAEKERLEMEKYERTLSDTQRTSVCMFAHAVNADIADVQNAASQGKHFGRKAEELLAELNQDSE